MPRQLFRRNLIPDYSAIKRLGLASVVQETTAIGNLVARGPGLLGIVTRVGIR